MALLFKSSVDDPKAWEAALKRRMPALDFRVWPDTGPPGEIEAALVWAPAPGELRRYPNLKFIASLGAGVDNILSDPALPPVPVTRIVDPDMAVQMSELALLHVLAFHRQMPAYAAQQREALWRALPQPRAAERTVGVMGLGQLGADLATKLVLLGFDVAGWSRSPKAIPGVRSFAGAGGLKPFLGQTAILVCLLPLTVETRGILNRATFAALPRGSYVVNLARGAHLVEDDLLAALDSGQLAGAALDVFAREPLPSDHPFWRHPKVVVTPHVATIATPETAASQIVENLRRARAGRPLENVVGRERGY